MKSHIICGNHSLDKIEVDTCLIVGQNDIIIPPEKSIIRAKQHLKENLKEIKIFKEGWT